MITHTIQTIHKILWQLRRCSSENGPRRSSKYACNLLLFSVSSLVLLAKKFHMMFLFLETQDYVDWESQIEAWQSPILSDTTLPDW